MSSLADIEMRWVDAWNELYRIVGVRRTICCQLPEGSVVDVEECKTYLQRAVYDGFVVRVEEAWVGHHRGVVVSQWREGSRG